MSRVYYAVPSSKQKEFSDDIFGMSNVLGRFIKIEKRPPFSFYYSPRNSSHGPRVKPVMNPEKMKLDDAGTLELCSSWDYIPGPNDTNASSKDINKMKRFFRKYLILFLLVWDKQLNDPDLGYYMQGQMSLAELMEDISFYPEYSEEMNEINTVRELEKFCRANNLVNMYGN